MKEYDFSGFEEPKKKKDFVCQEQKDFWEAFSKGAKDGEERDFFTGNIQTMSAFISYELERNKQIERDRKWVLKQKQ